MSKILLFSFSHILSVLIFAAPIEKPKASRYNFIENKGQIIDQLNNTNPEVLYLFNGPGLNVQLRQGGFSYEAIQMVVGPKGNKSYSQEIGLNEPGAELADSFQTHRVDISFLNCNKQIGIAPSDSARDYINYYTTGTKEDGITEVHHYKKVTYKNIYNDIDVEFIILDEKNRGVFKYNFIIHPGGNLNDIRLQFEGAPTSINDKGEIIIETALGTIEESIPLSYQITETGKQQPIEANFVSLNSNTYGVTTNYYNPNLRLVIDPTPWATYFGGIGNDASWGVFTGSSDNIVFAGWTTSATAIATSGAYQTVYLGNNDNFITKFNSGGTILWSTYYGGSSSDYASHVAKDKNQNILLTGYTTSATGIVTTGAHQTVYGGGLNFGDAFLAKFDSSGTRIWGTYIGGTSDDFGKVVCADTIGNIFIGGETSSTAAIATAGAFQTSFNGGNSDDFIVKFNSSGTRQWGTYFGGSGDEQCKGIASEKGGVFYLTGYTNSTSSIATTGSYQAVFGGGTNDAFMAKFNASGTRQWSTYYGGSGDDQGWGIALDTANFIVHTGKTNSTANISSTGAFKPNYIGGASDAYLVKFNSSGARQWATYYGGNRDDWTFTLTTDIAGSIYITGQTYSDSGLATVGAMQTLYGGGSTDAFIAKYTGSGNLLWSTYYGGSSNDYGRGIAVNSANNIVLTGSTYSTTNICTIGAYQNTLGGTFDAFLSVFTTGGFLPVNLIAFEAFPIREEGQQKVDLNWSTASEINNNFFTVERSNNSENFEKIGLVYGAGNSVKLINYQYRDEDPFSRSDNQNTQIGKLYYRLLQTDFDGTSTYSETKVVEFNQNSDVVVRLVYENDQSIIQINAFATLPVSMQLYDLNGVKVWSGSADLQVGLNTIPIQAQAVTGFYLLKLQMENEKQNFKVWIK